MSRDVLKVTFVRVNVPYLNKDEEHRGDGPEYLVLFLPSKCDSVFYEFLVPKTYFTQK